MAPTKTVLLMDLLPLKAQIKQVMIEELMLNQEPDEITDDTPIFGPDGLGLDSVDALQLVVAIEKHFGLKISDAELAKQVLHSVNTIADEIEKMRTSSPQ